MVLQIKREQFLQITSTPQLGRGNSDQVHCSPFFLPLRFVDDHQEIWSPVLIMSLAREFA